MYKFTEFCLNLNYAYVYDHVTKYGTDKCVGWNINELVTRSADKIPAGLKAKIAGSDSDNWWMTWKANGETRPECHHFGPFSAGTTSNMIRYRWA